MNDENGKKRLYLRGTSEKMKMTIKDRLDMGLAARVERAQELPSKYQGYQEDGNIALLQHGDSILLSDAEIEKLNLKHYISAGVLDEEAGPPLRRSPTTIPDRGAGIRRRRRS